MVNFMTKPNKNEEKEVNNLKSFEDSLQQLEKIVHTMEEKNLTLEESMECFSQGVDIIKQCQKSLAQTEQKIKILLEDNELTDYAG